MFLVRAAQNRITVDNRRILDAIRKKRCMGRVEITMPCDSRRNLKEREGVLQLRYGCFEIKRPAIRDKNKALKDFLEVWVIHAKEEKPPKGIEPIERFLMTNGPVETVEAAYGRVFYYTQRRKTGRFHYVLKSGRAAEKLQERDMDKTTLLVLTYSVIAVGIMNMTYIARLYPEKPCTVFFEEDEWKALYCAANKTKKAPRKPYSIEEAVTYLGRLGGPKRAPGDGPPGVKPYGWASLRLTPYWLIASGCNDSVGQV